MSLGRTVVQSWGNSILRLQILQGSLLRNYFLICDCGCIACMMVMASDCTRASIILGACPRVSHVSHVINWAERVVFGLFVHPGLLLYWKDMTGIVLKFGVICRGVWPSCWPALRSIIILFSFYNLFLPLFILCHVWNELLLLSLWVDLDMFFYLRHFFANIVSQADHEVVATVSLRDKLSFQVENRERVNSRLIITDTKLSMTV